MTTHLLCEAALQEADVGFYQLLEMVERVRNCPCVSVIPCRLPQRETGDRQKDEWLMNPQTSCAL